MRQDRLAALTGLAALKRDADLGALADASARLARAVAERAAFDAALTRQIRLAAETGEVPVLRALASHAVVAERQRAVLEADIARQAVGRDAARQFAAVSFGRAAALKRLQDKMARSPNRG